VNGNLLKAKSRLLTIEVKTTEIETESEIEITKTKGNIEVVVAVATGMLENGSINTLERGAGAEVMKGDDEAAVVAREGTGASVSEIWNITFCATTYFYATAATEPMHAWLIV
jgi:hypothetical protein